jgi:metal-responsive CopG/Arc/MetJ family transcriptional regulator
MWYVTGQRLEEGISVRLGKRLRRELELRAQEAEVPASHLVRRALRRYLRAWSAEERESLRA